jgi:hypothetical protein
VLNYQNIGHRRNTKTEISEDGLSMFLEGGWREDFLNLAFYWGVAGTEIL